MVLRDETRKAIDNDVYQKFGISYEEFSNLDFDEQQKNICNYHRKNKLKTSNKIMIGSGEHAVFLKKSDLGGTLEKYCQRKENRINGIIGEEKGFRKVLSLFNGRNR